MKHSLTKHRRLYGLLHDRGYFEHRHDMVYSFSSGRTENSSDLDDQEIDQMILHLEGDQPSRNPNPQYNLKGDKMRKRILSICYSIGWTCFDQSKKKMVVDMERLNAWLKKYSYKHKALNDYNYRELPQLVSQFEKMEATVL